MGKYRGSEGKTGSIINIKNMSKLNIAFDGRSSQELKKFIADNKDIFAS